MIKQALEKLVLGLVAGAFGAAVLFVHPEGKPRLWDVLIGGSGGSSSPLNVIWVDAPKPVNRMLVTADSALVPVSAQPAAAPAAASAPAAQPKNAWMRHLQGVLAFFDITGPASSRSSASASAGSSPAAAPAAGAPSSAIAASAAPAGAQAAATTIVNYGSAGRSDIMSSASGPVYNFSGSKR